MQIGFNYAYIKFKGDIVSLINNSGLPVTMVRYILEEILDVVKEQEKIKIEEEQKEYELSLQSENKLEDKQN